MLTNDLIDTLYEKMAGALQEDQGTPVDFGKWLPEAGADRPISLNEVLLGVAVHYMKEGLDAPEPIEVADHCEIEPKYIDAAINDCEWLEVIDGKVHITTSGTLRAAELQMLPAEEEPPAPVEEPSEVPPSQPVYRSSMKKAELVDAIKSYGCDDYLPTLKNNKARADFLNGLLEAQERVRLQAEQDEDSDAQWEYAHAEGTLPEEHAAEEVTAKFIATCPVCSEEIACTEMKDADSPLLTEAFDHIKSSHPEVVTDIGPDAVTVPHISYRVASEEPAEGPEAISTCSVCGEIVPLMAKKDDESFTNEEMAAHFQTAHPEEVSSIGFPYCETTLVGDEEPEADESDMGITYGEASPGQWVKTQSGKPRLVVGHSDKCTKVIYDGKGGWRKATVFSDKQCFTFGVASMALEPNLIPSDDDYERLIAPLLAGKRAARKASTAAPKAPVAKKAAPTTSQPAEDSSVEERLQGQELRISLLERKVANLMAALASCGFAGES